MKIVFNDGGVLVTSEIRFSGNNLIASDMYEIPICDIDMIEDGDEE